MFSRCYLQDVVVSGDSKENPQVLDAHRNRVTIGTDAQDGKVC